MRSGGLVDPRPVSTMKTQRVAHLLCHLLVLFPAASFAPSRGPRPSTCLRKKGGVEFEDFSSVGTVPAAARELSGALAEEQRDMAVISPLVNALPQWANVPPGEDVRFALLRGDWKLSFVRNVDTFSIVGTGLHKVALTRMEELFMSFSGKRKARARARARASARVLARSYLRRARARGALVPRSLAQFRTVLTTEILRVIG